MLAYIGRCVYKYIYIYTNIYLYVCVYVCVQACMLCVLSHFLSDSLRPYRLEPTRLLCPWHFLGKNTGVVYHFLFQGIFSAQGSNLLHLMSPESVGGFFTTRAT